MALLRQVDDRFPLRPALALALALAAALACATTRETLEPDPISAPVVERLSDEELRIRWPASFSQGPVAVYAGTSPDSIERGRTVALSSTRSATLEYEPAARPYFLLVPQDGGLAAIAAERRLPLRGPANFRDLGGYATADGRQVRWGRLYRSDDLSSLTSEDIRYLSSLDLQLICDFRSERERVERPSRPIEPGPPQTLDIPIEVEGTDPGAMRRKIRTGGITALELERTMLDAYRAFVTDHAAEFAAMFRRLEQPGSLPTLVHCTAGKDRTGFASALVLLALGVPRDIVIEDYLRTNVYLESFRRFVLRWIPLYSLFRTDPEDLLPLLEARREYLEAALDVIDENHGSVDAYLAGALGVNAAQLEVLRAKLLR